MTDGDWDAEEYRQQRAGRHEQTPSSSGWCSLQLAGIVTAVVLVARVTVRLVRR